MPLCFLQDHLYTAHTYMFHVSLNLPRLYQLCDCRLIRFSTHMWHHNMVFLFYFLLSWLVHTCRDRFVDALWQSIQSFKDFLLLSSTSMSCNVEIATWHEPQSRWLKLMFTPILWMNPASKFQNMDECVSNWWLVWLPILIFFYHNFNGSWTIQTDFWLLLWVFFSHNYTFFFTFSEV